LKSIFLVWFGTTTPGQKGQTRGSPLARTKDEDRCFFTDLWRLNGKRGRGTPSKEYLERVRARDLLVVSEALVVSHWWSSGGIPVLEVRNSCESPTSGQMD
jgi:hypothetical protein